MENWWLKPRAFRRPWEHSATEPPGHMTNNFSTVYTLPVHFKFVHEIPVGEIHKFPLYFLEEHTDLTTSPQCFFMLGAICNRWKIVPRPGSNPGPFADRANTLPLSYRATRSYHQQLFTLTLPGYIKTLYTYCMYGISHSTPVLVRNSDTGSSPFVIIDSLFIIC